MVGQQIDESAPGLAGLARAQGLHGIGPVTRPDLADTIRSRGTWGEEVVAGGVHGGVAPPRERPAGQQRPVEGALRLLIPRTTERGSPRGPGRQLPPAGNMLFDDWDNGALVVRMAS